MGPIISVHICVETGQSQREAEVTILRVCLHGRLLCSVEIAKHAWVPEMVKLQQHTDPGELLCKLAHAELGTATARLHPGPEVAYVKLVSPDLTVVCS